MSVSMSRTVSVRPAEASARSSSSVMVGDRTFSHGRYASLARVTTTSTGPPPGSTAAVQCAGRAVERPG